MIGSHPGRDLLYSTLKVRNFPVKVRWMKGQRELIVIHIKVVVERNGRNLSAGGNGVHDEEQRTKNRALRIGQSFGMRKMVT